MTQRPSISIFLCVILLLTAMPALGERPAWSQEMPAPDRTINMEIVLDSSGSMAAATSTGELRYTAAQSVLHNVIGALPEEPDVNVGLRVFGQGGDNTEAGYAESCVSTDLLVPVSGVDKPALTQAVDAFHPVGWTPMALALDSASDDFITTDSDSTTNVIVLVTDGLETCGGDPVTSAAALKASPHDITTYVIGFGTTADEQQTLNGVAQAGGGRLFGAENATELNSAVFDILQELEIVVGAGFIGGNAFGLLGSAPTGTVDVIGYSQGQYGAVPVVMHNNLGQDVSSVSVTMTIRAADGTLISVGESQGSVSPRYLRAGGYAIGDIYMGQDFVIPEAAQVEFDVVYGPAAIISPFERLDMDIVEAGIFEDRIVGSFENAHEVGGQHGINVSAVCFDGAGNPVTPEHDYLDTQQITSGEIMSFQINRIGYWQGLPCDAFLVTASAGSPISMPVQPVPTLPADDVATPYEVPATEATPDQTNHPLPSGNAPYPLPTQDPRLGRTYSNTPGVEDAAVRNFEASTDPGLFITVIVAKFDSPENARNAMPIVQERLTANMVAQPLPAFGEVIDLPVPEGFDASIASFFHFEGSAPSQYLSMIIVAQGDELYIFEKSGYSPSFDVGVVELLQSSVLTPADRGQGSATEPTWGIWGLIPITSEIPVGYVVSNNYVPRSFGPIPPE